jgi:hypothetical protein
MAADATGHSNPAALLAPATGQRADRPAARARERPPLAKPARRVVVAGRRPFFQWQRRGGQKGEEEEGGKIREDRHKCPSGPPPPPLGTAFSARRCSSACSRGWLLVGVLVPSSHSCWLADVSGVCPNVRPRPSSVRHRCQPALAAYFVCVAIFHWSQPASSWPKGLAMLSAPIFSRISWPKTALAGHSPAKPAAAGRGRLAGQSTEGGRKRIRRRRPRRAERRGG